jgi:hypothetical protein
MKAKPVLDGSDGPQRGDYASDLEHARASQAWSAEQLAAGARLAGMGLADWLIEELLILKELGEIGHADQA